LIALQHCIQRVDEIQNLSMNHKNYSIITQNSSHSYLHEILQIDFVQSKCTQRHRLLQVLHDDNHHFLVLDIRINPVAAEQIKHELLTLVLDAAAVKAENENLEENHKGKRNGKCLVARSDVVLLW
jgi:hypothetical protein